MINALEWVVAVEMRWKTQPNFTPLIGIIAPLNHAVMTK